MTQKDKVKELVGRSLNSYHTKSLQQIDRIEKKNKEQNHKISILSNELDNDYLTKTEEGSVISLEHSKEGMVYLDELQGNTLVNYCTDGSKEMTLNGDIDVEGTFVTTTEGVDNGKVDVICEGNTLVNLNNTNRYAINKAINDTNLVITSDTNYLKATTNGEIYNNNSWVYANFGKPKLSLLKPNTKYTVIGDIIKGIGTMAICDGSTANALAPFTVVKDNRALLTTNDLGAGIGGQILYGYIKNNEDQKVIDIEVKNLIILEGDWTNKQIPSEYFEGMKSVGQDDTNGHKIEILSSVGKPNLIKNSGFLNGISNYSFHNGSKGEIIDDTSSQSGKILKMTTGANGGVSGAFQANIVSYIENKKYTLSGWCKGEVGTTLGAYIERHKSTHITFTDENWVRFVLTSEQNPTNWNRTITFYSDDLSKTFYLKDIKIEESENDTPYIPHITEKNYNSFNKLNKKEISLNEPLRELPNGVKDKFVKIGGKYYVERNCGEIMLNGDEVWNYWNLNTGLNNDYISFYMSFNGKNYEPNVSYDLISDILVNVDNTLWYRDLTSNSVALNADINISLQIGVKKSDLQTQDVVGFKQWLKTNKPKIVYKLKTPFYEPLEIEPTLNTYSDTTHISNNSIIPCNMKVKNTGYNAIIKPSTLYTVALDTNKNGTIGINLGGAKGTTTNNVLTLTTPATLTDDSLRLYGKGIKGSKVRLLEGDKTNWMPSHFEGMKSSFEDKLQSDGTYKMEILMNNKNLFDANCFKDLSKWNVCMGSSSWKYYPIYIGKNKKAYMKRVYKDNLSDYPMVIVSKDKDYGMNIGGWMPIIHDNVTEKVYKGYILPDANGFIYLLTAHTDYNKLVATIENCIISTVDVDYIEQKSNKIQFSSIEPLRSLPSGVKDKFIFKDSKLMIERNTSKTKITSDMNFTRSYEGWANIVFACEVDGLIPIDISTKNVYCNVLPSFNIAELCNALGKTGIASHGWINNRCLQIAIKGIDTVDKLREWISERDMEIVYQIEPTYEEIPFELQKIILEGYENGTLFFDTNIPPTSTVTYAGETPIVKSVKLNKTEVLNNTTDINDNIVPYLMDMDYRVVCLQLEGGVENVSMARLFGGTYEMLQRDILSNRYSVDEYKHRLDAYLGANKITHEEYNKLGDMLNE